jgi:hypothetical protein
LFSNTARAHQLEKTRDWVVLYCEARQGDYQCTIITAQHGPLAAKRVVRGREAECARHYRQVAAGTPSTVAAYCGGAPGN